MSDGAGLASRWNTIRAGADETPAPEVAEEKSSKGTFIGSGARFEGTLQLTGDFQIDSEFHGELRTDGKLVVGEAGSVEGDIHAREVEIRGAVVGNVVARRLLVVYEGAKLHGDIETACLEIQRHAFFQGSTAMTRPQAATRTPATTVAAQSASPPSPPVI